MRAFAVAFAVALGAAASLAPGCAPYDPSLPDEPFLCGADEPRCPDGYTCVADAKGRMVCAAHALDAGLDAKPAATARTCEPDLRSAIDPRLPDR